MEKLKEYCGVVGIYSPGDEQGIDVRQYLTLALTALQHRGQESAGMAVYDEHNQIYHRVGMGKVREVFSDSALSFPVTRRGIGHTRYSTTGSSSVENSGPFVAGHEPLHDRGAIAVAHNGNLVNGKSLFKLLPENVPTIGTTDSEAMTLLLLHAEGDDFKDRLKATAPLLKGAYSLVIMDGGTLYAIRDPWGMRPLSLGRIGDTWIVASETCAFDRIGATFVREIKPGELITLDESGMSSEQFLEPVKRQSLCVFENIYFADATSQLNGRYTYLVREAFGRELHREYPVEADLIIPVPDSSIPAALGYAEESGIPYGHGIIKNRYSDRTFIKPDQRLRQLEVDLKYNFVKPKIEGKRLIIVDDSIVRGNTVKRLVAALRQQGVKEIHLRSSSPPIRHPCYFGIDMPAESELIASGKTTQEIADYIGVDSLGYLSIPGMSRALQAAGGNQQKMDDKRALNVLHQEFCYGCMDRTGWPFDPIPYTRNEDPDDLQGKLKGIKELMGKK